jgi:hypothetical protein
MASDKPKPNSDEELLSWDVDQLPYRSQPVDTRALIGNTTSHKHNWEARGDFLHCTVGNHGIPYDHLHKRFTGTDSRGLPLYEPVKLQTHRKKDGKVTIKYTEVDS